MQTESDAWTPHLWASAYVLRCGAVNQGKNLSGYFNFSGKYVSII